MTDRRWMSNLERRITWGCFGMFWLMVALSAMTGLFTLPRINDFAKSNAAHAQAVESLKKDQEELKLQLTALNKQLEEQQEATQQRWSEDAIRADQTLRQIQTLQQIRTWVWDLITPEQRDASAQRQLLRDLDQRLTAIEATP